MSKVTFRADEDLIRRVEALDASKSEVMREALRAYLDGSDPRDARGGRDAPNDAAADSVEAAVGGLDVTISIEPAEREPVRRTPSPEPSHTAEPSQPSQSARGRAQNGSQGGRSCGQCGEELSANHVYCPNCGEKAANRLFCDCGDEIRSDWAYCPSCGRRTPSADVLDG